MSRAVPVLRKCSLQKLAFSVKQKKNAHKIPSANWQTLIALYVKLTTLTNQVYPPQYQTETT